MKAKKAMKKAMKMKLMMKIAAMIHMNHMTMTRKMRKKLMRKEGRWG